MYIQIPHTACFSLVPLLPGSYLFPFVPSRRGSVCFPSNLSSSVFLGNLGPEKHSPLLLLLSGMDTRFRDVHVCCYQNDRGPCSRKILEQDIEHRYQQMQLNTTHNSKERWFQNKTKLSSIRKSCVPCSAHGYIYLLYTQRMPIN